jgi:aspartate aminotransferase/aminotransferase
MQSIVQAMSIQYNNLVYELKDQGIDVIVLSLGEAFFDIPLYPWSDLPYPTIYHYSHSRGIPELREKLAAYYGREYGVPVDPEKEILVTAGSKIGIHMAFMAILNPGDEVIIHEPAWVSYPEQVRLCHGVPVLVPYDVEAWDIGKYVTERTRAIVINNPNNPRGYVMSERELGFLHELAVREGLYLLSDEAYSDFLPEGEPFVTCGLGDPRKEHTILCNSMSKSHGISGWRIGYVVTRGDLLFQILKINQHLITCPATVLQYYLAKHFEEILSITKPQIQEVVQKRKQVAEYLDSRGIRYLAGTATFYLFVSLGKSKLSSEEFCTRLLREYHVSTVPGLGYGQSCDHFIRLSVGTESVERIFNGVRMIDELIHETSDETDVKGKQK